MYWFARSKPRSERRRRHEQNARLLPLLFTTKGSSHSKRISTDAILALTSLPNSFMDVVASLTHDPLPKCYIDRTRVQRLKFILPPIGPRNLKPRNLILGALLSFSRKFPPTKITRYTVYYMYTYLNAVISQKYSRFNIPMAYI